MYSTAADVSLDWEARPPVDAYDSDWLYTFVDHAVNQLVFVYVLFLLILVLLIDPSELVSLGHHQRPGNCVDEESYRSSIWKTQTRKKFLCVHDFDEDFSLCNYPLTQLHYEDSWYMICGRGYGMHVYPNYVAIIVASAVGLNLLFYQILKRPANARRLSFNRKHK